MAYFFSLYPLSFTFTCMMGFLFYSFGAKIRSNETGIVYNNHMGSFSIPKSSKSYQIKSSKFNYVAPGKRSLSTACPAIVVDKAGSVRMVVGGSGALRITSGVPTVIASSIRYIHVISLILIIFNFSIL